jgi:hypothetical protein
MKKLKKNSENILFAALFLIVAILYGLKVINEALLLGLLGSIATIYFGVLKLKIENDILFKELFESFNERYDTDLNDLINTLKNDPRKKLTNDERNHIIDYFNLCAEEFLWNKKKRIPNDVWEAWKAGIQENLEIEQIKEVYDFETSTERGRISYYGMFYELKK